MLRAALAGAAIACTAATLLVDAIPGTTTALLIGLVLLGAATGLHPIGRTMRRVTAIGLAVATGLVMFTPLLDQAVAGLDVTEQPQSADVIVILGGSQFCPSGDLDAPSYARITRGLALWKAGFAPGITISDSAFASPGCVSQREATVRFIDGLYGPGNGPPITFLADILTTKTEAQAVAKLQQAQGWHRVLVVTDAVHSYRARRIFRDAGVDAFVVSSGEARFNTGFGHPWDRLRALGPVVREFAGLLKYRLSR
jgi:uncharacterized SAM-binding protein YcdF (DUF218 family)